MELTHESIYSSPPTLALTPFIPAAAPQITIYENEVNIGLSSESFRGSIDEVKFYDHALSYSEIEELYAGVAANDVPFVDISMQQFFNRCFDSAAEVLNAICFRY